MKIKGNPMEFVDYLGDNRLRHKIVYDKNSYSECIYCGNAANTREHIPSKVFLVKPFPNNLGIVPACQNCNKSFSNDELFLSLLIEIIKSNHYGKGYILPEKSKIRMNYNKKMISDIKRLIENKELDQFNKKISNILFKLAVGHSVYELSEGYCIKNGQINYSFLNRMSTEEINEFILPFDIGGNPLPEVGSRVYERILIVELNLTSIHDSEQKLIAPLLLLDWVDVQDTKYTYTCYKFGNEIIVKIIINDFMYAKVIINVT